MRFAIVSKEGDGAGLALRLHDEGNEVSFWNALKSQNEIITGFGIKRYFGSNTPLLEFIRRHHDWHFIFDSFEWGSIQEKMREHHIPVIGTNRFGQKIEVDREWQYNFARSIGVKIPEYHVIESIPEVVNFIKLHPQRYILKQTGGMPKTLNFAAQENDSSDLIDHLEAVQSKTKLPKGKLILQKLISGTEVAASVFVVSGVAMGRGDGPIIFENFEHKKFLEGNRGLTTGEMGTGIIAYEGPHRIYDEMLRPIIPYLTNYTGEADANCILDDSGQLWLVEWTLRLGYPAIYIELAMLDEPVWAFFSRLYSMDFTLRFKVGEPHVGLVLAFPHFPIEDITNVKDSFYNEHLNLKYLSHQDVKDVYLIEVKKSKGKTLISSETGYAGIFIGRGQSFTEASQNAQNLIEKVPLSKFGFYRRDIGESSDARYKKVASALHQEASGDRRLTPAFPELSGPLSES